MSAYLLDVTSSRNRNTHKKNKIKKVGKKRSCGATCQNYCFTYVTFRKMAKRLRNIKKETPPPKMGKGISLMWKSKSWHYSTVSFYWFKYFNVYVECKSKIYFKKQKNRLSYWKWRRSNGSEKKKNTVKPTEGKTGWKKTAGLECESVVHGRLRWQKRC